MKIRQTTLRFFSALSLLICFCACQNTLPTSKYARHNQFAYSADEPGFKYSNTQLQIQDGWDYNALARVVPKQKYLPDTIQNILSPIVKEHGSILFTAFQPRQSKYQVDKYVKVKKKAVQYKGRLPQSFMTVLISEKPFDTSHQNFVSAGQNESFTFYRGSRLEQLHDRVVYQVIARDSLRYYTFVHIYDPSYFTNSKDSAYHVGQLLADAEAYFKKTSRQQNGLPISK